MRMYTMIANLLGQRHGQLMDSTHTLLQGFGDVKRKLVVPA